MSVLKEIMVTLIAAPLHAVHKESISFFLNLSSNFYLTSSVGVLKGGINCLEMIFNTEVAKLAASS